MALRKSLIIALVLLLLPSLSFSRAKKKDWLDQAAEGVAKKVQLETMSVPENEETCFAPDEPCDLKLVKFVRSAQKSIDVAIYDINLDQLVHELLVQAKKIPVRFVVDRRQAVSDHSLVSTLVKAGAQVRFGRQRGIMHNKFIILDGEKLELGSFNYTNGAAFKNQENQLYLTSPKIVSRYRERFEKMWSAGDVVTAAKLR